MCVSVWLVKSMQLLALLPVLVNSLIGDEVDVGWRTTLLPLSSSSATLRGAVRVPSPARVEIPIMAHHVQKKATKHHHHTRPRKSRPSDIFRKPTNYPELPDIPWYTKIEKTAGDAPMDVKTAGDAPMDAASDVLETQEHGDVLVSRAGQPQMMAKRPHLNKPALNRAADQRKAKMRALTTEVLRHGRIRTTLAWAKEVRGPVEHMVTLAKDGSLHARRQALAYLYDKQLVHGIFEQVPERYGDRNGGYTRVIKDGFRRGDNSEMGIIELV